MIVFNIVTDEPVRVSLQYPLANAEKISTEMRMIYLT